MVLFIQPGVIELLAMMLLSLMGLYLFAGLVFYLVVFRKQARVLDEGVDGAPRWFWVLTFPGVLALWPVVYANIRKIKQQA